MLHYQNKESVTYIELLKSFLTKELGKTARDFSLYIKAVKEIK